MLTRILAITALIAAAPLVAIGCQSKPEPTPGPAPAPSATHKLGDIRTTPPPAPQASWATAAWFVDPVSGSDTNNCTSSGTACKTFNQIAIRWGTYAPILAQTTTITLLSDQPDNTDPVILKPEMTNGSLFILKGTLTTKGTGTLASVTVKNRATPQLLKADLGVLVDAGSPAIAAGQLVVNSTHASAAWVDSVSSNTATFSQPMSNPQTLPAFAGWLSENNSWANSDAVTIQQGSKIYLKDFSPTTRDALFDASAFTFFSYAGVIEDVWVQDPTSTIATSHTKIGAWVSAQRVRWDTLLDFEGGMPTALANSGANTHTTPSFDNCYMTGVAARNITLNGGDVVNWVLYGGGVTLDGDILLHYQTAPFFNYIGASSSGQEGAGVNIGSVYVSNDNATLSGLMCGGWCRFVASSETSYGGPVLWGPGIYDGLPGSTGAWENPNVAGNVLLLTGNIKLCGETVATSYNLTSATWYPAFTLNASKLGSLVDSGGYLSGTAGPDGGGLGSALNMACGARIGAIKQF